MAGVEGAASSLAATGALCCGCCSIAALVSGGTLTAGIVGVASTFSIARVGVGSARWANTVSGGVFQTGRLANCSCAARSRAAAPRPKITVETDSRTAANRKRKPGSMTVDSVAADWPCGSFSLTGTR